jgi:3-methyladenine DNA glycosylase AlkD
MPQRSFYWTPHRGYLLDRYSKLLTPAALPALRKLIEQKPWWDSVDQLTGRVVGPLVLRHPELRREMDRWSRDPDFWLRRASIIHQLSHGDETDDIRLFDYCERNARDTEFFIRKAIGWALRQHARRHPEAVRDFVATHPELSPLSRREALKHDLKHDSE